MQCWPPSLDTLGCWKVSVLGCVSPSCFLSFILSPLPPPLLTNPNLCSDAGISFIPREVGEHLVSIKKNGNHVANSPVSIMVVQSEIGDARRAKVYGRGLSEGRTFEMSEFIVDTRDAGLWGKAHRNGLLVAWAALSFHPTTSRYFLSILQAVGP